MKSKLLWVCVIAAALVGLYALLGFKLAPRLVRSQAVEFVRENYGRELAIGEVRVHPFKLQLEIRDLALPDEDGAQMLGFARLFADFQIASLWKRAFVFREVRLEKPTVRALTRPDGSMNLAELALPEEPNEPESPLPRVWIELLEVSDGSVDYMDRARARPYAKSLRPVAFTLRDFRTTAEGGEFQFVASTDNAEKIEWNGRFALEPVVNSTGDFALTALSAKGVGEFLGDDLPFDLVDGDIELAGSYTFVLGEQVQFDARLPVVGFSKLRLLSRDAEPVGLTIPAATISDTTLSLQQHSVTIGRLAVAKLTGKVALERDGSIDLLRLMGPTTPPAATAAAEGGKGAAVAPASAANAGGTDWRVEVAAVEISDAALQLEDRTVTPSPVFALSPVNVTLTAVTTDLSKPLPMTLAMRIDGKATLQARGTVTLDPFATGLDIALDGLDLPKLQPYIASGMDLQIQRGRLQTRGRLELAPPAATGPEMSYAGDVTIADFGTVDNALTRDFIKFERLDLSKLEYSMAPDALSIDKVALRKPYANVIIGSNQVLNVSAVLDPAGTAKALKVREAAELAGQTVKPVKKAPRKPKKSKTAAATPAPPLAPLPAETMPIRIRELRIGDGVVDFADFFVQPNFQAQIIALNGSVTGISSDPASRAKIDLNGKLDEFSPVVITGELQPFAFDRYTKVQMRFENISLPIFNPYSGRLAGYSIAKGKLTTELNYLIQDRALDAKHRIRIDQLEWGSKTATKDAATLPVKFATSLLKDRNGVIALDLPITGTIDDPKFRIGPIIWQVIKNIITKAVTAPFAALGSLFEGAEEAQFVSFDPGLATLPPAAAESLSALARGLVERPAIRLDVPVGVIDEVDRPAMLEATYLRERDAAVRSVTGTAEGAPAPAYDSLGGEQKIAALSAMLTKQTGSPPQIPAPPAPPEGSSKKDARELEQRAALEFLEQESRARTVPDEAQFAQLAEQRAVAIQGALLRDTGLDPLRVFLTKEGKLSAQDGKVRYELELK